VTVNLYSDTQTRPTEGMRRAIAGAEVGDEQRGLDPTVNALQERVAELLGQDAALFLPSGTLCNEISIRLHIRPGGDEMYLHRSSHPIVAEAGGPAAFSGAMIRALDGDGGMYSPDELEGALHAPGDRYAARSRLVCVEQTTNLGGGRVWSRAGIEAVLEVARQHGLRAHLDGARLMNAAVASGEEAASFASGFDTAWLDFTKGLGAPVGEAWRYKQMLGGALRQAGIVAAAGLYALDHHVERLAEDHANARALAEGLASIDGVAVAPDEVETNIVLFDVADAAALVDRLAAQRVEMSRFGPTRVRAVTHLDVDRAGIDRALVAVRDALRG
jgi:threonine aldolase